MKPKEIRHAVKFLEKMLRKVDADERPEMLGWNRPDRDWSKPK